jgi:hypothetical protein
VNQPTQPKKTEWITHLLAAFVLWQWWDYRSMSLLYWVLGFCAVDYFLVKFAQRAMDNQKDRVRAEWMLLSMVVKSCVLGMAISSFFWHPQPGHSL